ncbi:MAG: aldo/keto reductase [Coriobacteriia bacterium]|nr:aldo/keto reductase [Coriobacteriia bacterium]
MPYRCLGRTGEKVSVVGLGGFHLGKVRDRTEGVRLVHAALENGVNFLDNSWDYHDGESERLMGEALKGGYRDRAFVMTKVDGRTGSSVRSQLEESLRRLAVDVIDLVQFHEIIRLDDPKRIFEEGAAEEMLAARDEGLLRYIGFTGHKDPRIHLRMLETADFNAFVFDAVQMPLNVFDAQYNSFEKLVLPLLVERDIGVLGMKPLGSGRIPETGAASATECLHYAMNLPTSTVITGCENMQDLQQALHAAHTFEPMTDGRLTELLRRTAPYAVRGAHEEYKTTEKHDGTARNPQWLG